MQSLRNIYGLLIGAVIMLSPSVFANTAHYFGNIRYNHVSPHVPLKGIIPLTQAQAKNRPHFIFNVNKHGKITSIVDNSYNVVKRHHIASFGAFKTLIEYDGDKEVRTFFDINNQPMANIKGVFKEVYLYDNQHFKKQLNFFDKNDKPVESNWNIHEYQWRKHDNFVIEKRVNLKGEQQPLSPYFAFDTTKIEYDQAGNPFKHFNVNEQLNVVNNKTGVAYYQDKYDSNGLHTRFSYFDKNGTPVNNQWGFTYADKNYDALHNYVDASRYDTNHTFQPSPKPIKANMPASKADEKEIIRISQGYLVALQQLKPTLMAEVMHKDLSKHTIGTFADGQQRIRPTTYEQMINFAYVWNKDGTRFPPNPSNEAIILDSYNGMASVKLVSDNWVEYLHLLKLEGKWKIKNLVWDYNAPPQTKQ
ncbi:nuclear transport factor 2 family protein [Colwelliaceae bacterium 6441]